MYQIFKLDDEPMMIVKHQDDNYLWIPLDTMNADYQQYLAWVAEGNTVEEWSPEDGN